MISIAVSAISIVLIVVVTVVLINKSYDAESQRKLEMKKVVDQINTINASAASIESKQNTTLAQMDTGLSGMTSNIQTIQNDFVRKVDMTNKVESQSGVFKNILLGSNVAMSSDRTSPFSLRIGGDTSAIMGFDNTDLGKRMLFGTELSIVQNAKPKTYTGFDEAGDVLVRTSSDKSRLMLQNNMGPGIVLKGNKVGIGADPKFGDLDVNGNVVARGGSFFMGVGADSNALRAMGIVGGDVLSLNPDSKYAKVTVESDVIFNGNVYMKNGSLQTLGGSNGIVLAGDKVGIGMTPVKSMLEVGGDVGIMGNNMYMGGNGVNVFSMNSNMMHVNRDGTLSGVNFTGDVFLSSLKNSSNINMVVGGGAVPQMSVTNKGVSVNDMYTQRGMYQNAANKYWTVFNNNNTSLVFNPGEYNSGSGSVEPTGVVSISPDGDIAALGGGSFKSKVDAVGDMSTAGNLYGTEICSRAGGNDICLSFNDISALKRQAQALNTGTKYVSLAELDPNVQRVVAQMKAAGEI